MFGDWFISPTEKRKRARREAECEERERKRQERADFLALTTAKCHRCKHIVAKTDMQSVDVFSYESGHSSRARPWLHASPFNQYFCPEHRVKYDAVLITAGFTHVKYEAGAITRSLPPVLYYKWQTRAEFPDPLHASYEMVKYAVEVDERTGEPIREGK